MSAICPSCHVKLTVATQPGRYPMHCPECHLALVVTVARDGTVTTAAQPAAPDADPTLLQGEADLPDLPADLHVPRQIGNYEIIKCLGRGGMGAVYLARQKSLDRLVALKIIDERLARDKRFLVRFTREAYAAAQLAHHNIVQVYDFGAEGDIVWFSMEYVDGMTLGKLLASRGRLDPNTAAGYILQAARGLEYAHQRGMVHRDIKPDNLMLNQHDIIKVADLGLVLAPGTANAAAAATAVDVEAPVHGSPTGTLASLAGVTMVHQTMGTPAFMAPEQIRSASTVDERADIYSLGCTLYLLLTGRPVFRARTPQDMLQKQLTEPIARPETHVKSIPKGLSNILMKMVAKEPADRFATTGALIRALERFLGVGGDNRARIAQEHADTLARAVRAYHAVPAAQYRPWAFAGGFALCGILMLMALAMGLWVTAGGLLGLTVLTPVAYFVTHGAATRSYLFQQTRQYVIGLTLLDWLKVAGGLLVFVLILAIAGLLWVWIIVCGVAIGVAVGIYLLLDRFIARERQTALAAMERIVRALRVRGINESAIQKFVCQYAGEHWEAPFEELFGYEAKLTARVKWGVGPKGPRPRFAVWRDPVVRWIAARQRSRQEARERRQLQVVEQQGLVAEGMQPAEARRQAEAVAEAMVEQASQIKDSGLIDEALVEEVEPPVPQAKAPEADTAAVPMAEVVDEIDVLPPPPTRPRPRVDVRQVTAAATRPPRPRRKSQFWPEVRDKLLGPAGRFGVGGILLALGVAGLYFSNIADELRTFSLAEPGGWEALLALLVQPRTIVVGLTLEPMTALAAAVAGLLLVLSSFQPLRWRTLALYVGALVMVAGPFIGVPAIGTLGAAAVSGVAGAVPMIVVLVMAWMRPPE
jgi:tRNA A-37 threonylcarbamoyl transferase component Bud32